MQNKRIVGIDFGTSTTVIRVKTYDQNNEPLEDKVYTQSVTFDGKSTVPTVVCKTDSGTYLCGEKVIARSENGQIFTNFKIDLISRDPEKKKQAIKLISSFLKHLYEAYKEQEPHFPPCANENTRTLISYPAKWPEDLRRTMMRLAEEAGFKNVDGYDEPTAAIHAIMTQQAKYIQESKRILPGQSAYILLADLGAGTTDLALCKYIFGEKTEPYIFATWPMADNTVLFGGQEIDKSLCKYLKEYLQNCGLKKLDRFASPKMINNAKSWKENYISPALRKNASISEPGFLETYTSMLPVDPIDFPVINRTVFETVHKDYIKLFPKLINDFMNAAKGKEGFNGSEDVDFVILTGGHSQWYFLDDLLLGKPLTIQTEQITLPKIQAEPDRLMRLTKPQETVALGLVYMPMHINVKTCSANSVWARFEVGGKKLDTVKVVEYGAVLPYEKRFQSSVQLTRSLTDSDIPITCVKYDGQSLDSALTYSVSKTISRTSFTAIWDWLKKFFVDTDTKTINMEYTIKINENQISEISVTVSADGFNSVEFTF